MENYTILPRSFIKSTLIDNIDKIIKSQQAYLSFALIAIGIEFLGKCINDDLKDWYKGSSGEQFNLAIEELMPKYRAYNLYSLLRCGMAHSMAPKDGLLLGEDSAGDVHLAINERGYLTLTIEQFFKDFKKACEIVVNNIDKAKYKTDSKIYRPFLQVTKN